jgi:formate hydrogenlyase transcriptional activator
VVDALANYHWPGNIRELQNVLERSVILTNGTALQVPMHELTAMPGPLSAPEASAAGLQNAEREKILKALAETRGMVGGPDGAAARLGLKRTTLQSRMRKYNISRQFC